MRFLIIGASGFVGSNIFAHVKGQGFEAVGTQSRNKVPDLVTFDLLQHRITQCVSGSFFEGSNSTVTVITAVISNMDLCLQQRTMSRRVNVEQTIRLIEDLHALGTKIIFLSSCFVFDGTTGYYNEDHPVSPANEYGKHKVEVERYLQSRVPNAFIARLDKVVGDNPAQPQLFGHWYERLAKGEPIVCLQGSLLSPTYVKDVARAVVAACAHDMRGIYHVSNSEFFYRDELARQFCFALDREPNIVSKPLDDFHFADNRALKSYLDGSRFSKDSGLRFTAMRQVFSEFRSRIQSKR